ncbi:cbb3-type cytochrome c oxidase subunit 3 [Streptomyces sp. NBC_01451]|uniref:cbb3-type cytochrome c oxidase subunit 3 n=1 Tax=Streptomyces sp. NBC_01451 TaxID=2903872 RepID=UPI002E32BA5E|nr:cbb3-type cytochrome c oxidase subunit 3 [Streptomyces sp. NBC_01451]
MTATAALAAPDRPAAQRTGRLHGLTWTLLRVHRGALWFWLLYVVVIAAVLLWAYGPGAHAAMDELARSGCRDGGIPNPGCDTLGPRGSRWDSGVALGSSMIALAPVLIATWAGGSLIGRELEDGTAQLTWTQSVSPARWLAAKLALPAVLIIAGMLPLTLLHRMMWTANPELRRDSWSWFDSQIFNANGILATVCALFGLAFGVLVGMVARRSAPAFGVSLFGSGFGLQYFQSLRPHLWLAETLRSPAGFTDEFPDDGMTAAQGSYTSTGARLPDLFCGDSTACVTRNDVVGVYRDYHPASHFWPLQLVETGIVLALAAAATAAAFWLLRRRTV